MFNLIIFDLDGVLWISNEAHVEVCRLALQKAGINVDVDAKKITSFFGLPYREVLKAVMGNEYTPERLDSAYREQQRLLYDSSFFRKVRKIDGVEAVLHELKKKGIKLAVASGNERTFLDKALDYLKLTEFFDLTLSADDVSNSKPNPEIILKAMNTLNVSPEDTLFVGDAINDVLAAKKARVYCAIVLTGVLTLEEAEDLDPDFILDSVVDVSYLV